MRNHLSSVVFGALGLLTGFTLCYCLIVLPDREERRAGASQVPQRLVMTQNGIRWQVVPVPPVPREVPGWPAPLIQPMLPPKIVSP
jgi:hypothetical protein